MTTSAILDAFQPIIDLANYLTGGELARGNCFGLIQHDGQSTKHKCRELCFPRYQATRFDEVEEQREELHVALTGQILVVSCRAATGDFAGAVVGAVIFVLGNQARCTLKVSHLTAYVALSGIFGMFDALAFVTGILHHGTSFFIFPMSENLLQDLTAIELAMAPVCQLKGAMIAYHCYPSPELLFEQRPASDAMMWRMPIDSPPPMPPMRRGYNSPAPMVSGTGFLQTGTRSSAASSAGEETGGIFNQLQEAAQGFLARSSTGGPAEDEVVHCQQCNAVVRSDEEGWSGTGNFENQLFCRRCWEAWGQ